MVPLLAMLAACGAGTITADAPPPAAAIHPSWAELGLPLGDGRVVFSDPDLMTVEFSAGEASALGASFREVLRAAGYAVASDTSAGDLVSMSLTRGEVPDCSAVDAACESIALAVIPSGPRSLTVSLTRFAAEPR